MKSNLEFGIIGLGVMGKSLAQNIERNGFSVAGYDTDSEKVNGLNNEFNDKHIECSSDINEFLASLARPRRILMMVPAGDAVDELISKLKPHLEEADILIDGGNSYFKDTERRTKELEEEGFRFIGTGVSGGEEGALWGPCIMPGGTESAYKLIEPILTKISAKADGIDCCTYIGSGGAGHFVKMVHNAIEYGDMQIICEAYDILKNGLGLNNDEIKDVFTKWKDGELNSYLLDISADIFGKIDEETGTPLVELIMDTAGQKGTGKWTAQTALDLGVPVPTLIAAVEARIMSSLKKERIQFSKMIEIESVDIGYDKDQIIDVIEDALILSKILCYAQGLSLMKEASKEYGYKFNYSKIAKIWKGGCIIRAKILDKISAAYDNGKEPENLIWDEDILKIVERTNGALRVVVSYSAMRGIPVPAFNASLFYFDAYRSERLPANLLQAQRDYFGAHTYKRIDKEGVFHTKWI